MEILNDILTEIQTVKNENQELKQSLVKLTESLKNIDFSPKYNISSEQVSSLIWKNMEPKLGNVSQSIKPQIDQFQKIVNDIPKSVQTVNTKEFKIFNGNWFAFWGIIFLGLLIFSFFVIPAAKAKYAENDIENTYLENQKMKEQIKYFSSKNPETAKKYFE